MRQILLQRHVRLRVQPRKLHSILRRKPKRPPFLAGVLSIKLASLDYAAISDMPR